jgi:hypothetical protein
MRNHSRSLIALCKCLRGELPKNVDWVSLIGLANETLTTPALMHSVGRFDNEIPSDVSHYVREMFVRNQYRNQHLCDQLSEAVMALNKVGVTPVLLKSAGTLATTENAMNVFRLISDLDVMISSEEIEIAMEALFAIGYQVFYSSAKGAAKWYVDLQRDGDVGMIDLHACLPGDQYFYRSIGNIRHHSRLSTSRFGTAYVPFPTYQAFILVVHDEFQDADYWTGSIDLRHLLDLYELASSAKGIDWRLLASMSPSRLYRNALETQLLALHALFEVDVPTEFLGRFIPRLQFHRRLIQARLPFFRQAFLATALLDYRNYRTEVGAEERTRKTSKPGLWSLPKIATLRFLLDRSAERRPGKV